MSSIESGPFGLGGVLLGGLMTTGTIAWQSVSSRKARISELELQLRHERVLRDEAAKRPALLELIYALRKFYDCIALIEIKHSHGKDKETWPAKCTLDFKKTISGAAKPFLEASNKYAALFSDPTRNAIWVCVEAWEDLLLYSRYRTHEVSDGLSEDGFCEVGVTLVHMDARCMLTVKALEDELISISGN